MTLYKKTVLIISIVIVALILLFYGSSRYMLLGGFLRLEEKITRQNVERARDALTAEIADLNSKTGDWASWDYSYAFIEDANPEFIRKNLTDNAFSELGINIMVFVDSSGKVVFSKTFPARGLREEKMPTGMGQYLAKGGLLLQHRGVESSVKGILLLPGGPVLVASRPILNSMGNGPIMGSLIFGKYLDSALVARLSGVTHLPVTLYRADDKAMSQDMRAVFALLSKDNALYINPVNEHTIVGYALLNDIYGNKAGLLRVDMSRDIYQQSQNNFYYFILSSLVIGVVLGTITLIFMERLVLSRLTRLSRIVDRIGTSGDLSLRVPVTGRDEVSLLSEEFNKMLVALEQSARDLRKSEEMFRAISVTANDAIVMLDPQALIVLWNVAAQRIFGYSPEEVMGRDLYEFLIPARFKWAHREGLGKFRETGEGPLIGKTIEVSALRKDGMEFPIELSLSALHLEGSWNSVGIVRDITRRKNAIDALTKSEERYRTLVENINIGVYRNTPGPQGRFIHANKAMAKIFGYDSFEEFSAVHAEELYQNPDERKLYVDKILKQGYIKAEELKLKKRDGSKIWGSLTAMVHYGDDGEVLWIDGVIEDITERKQMEESLRSLSLRDELTGLYNRRGFFTLAEQHVKIANRMAKGMLLIFADLDDMKYINDTYGHQEGDRALSDTAAILKKTFRESDIVARFGGDEFVILSLETPESSAFSINKRLLEHLDYHNKYERRPYTLSLSIGVARYDSGNPVTLDDLLVQADGIMYEQKKIRRKQRG
jgi:diguanylate cyclase (GGDEF)-like protein/PAS domain S-box-containing protein